MKLAQRPTKPKKAAKFAPSTTQIIMLSFLGAILLGSALLVLPFSTKSGESVDYIDALFTAVSATCVTGLVTLPTVATWSVFGQIVIFYGIIITFIFKIVRVIFFNAYNNTITIHIKE